MTAVLAPFSVARRWRVMRQLLVAHWQVALAYRGMMLVSAIQGMMPPLVLMLAWLSVERAASNTMSDGEYRVYFLALPVVMHLTACWIHFSLPGEIREGTLNRSLLKPLHPLWHPVFEHLAGKTLQLAYVLPPPLLLAWFWRDRLASVPCDGPHLLAFVAALLLAVVLRFVMNTTLALTGFWIEHVETLNLVLNMALWAMLGGMVVPLPSLPPAVQQITAVLPYRYTVGFPLEIMLGRVSGTGFVAGMAVGVAWCVGLGILGWLLWRRGLRAYTGYGG